LRAIYDGATRTEAAKIGPPASGFRSSGTGCCASTPAGPDALLERQVRTGQPCKLNDLRRRAHRRHDRERPESRRFPWRGALGRLIDSGAMESSRNSASRIAKPDAQSGSWRAMGYRKLSARPRHHAQKRRGAIEDFKKSFPVRLEEKIGARQGARLRHDRNLVRRRGSHRPERTRSPVAGRSAATRPSAPRDQRTASTYIFGAVMPEAGQRAQP